MNCKQPLALTVGQAPPYPMLRQKPVVACVAAQPTRTQKTGDACLWHTRYGLP